jgi:hypothetical protein
MRYFIHCGEADAILTLEVVYSHVSDIKGISCFRLFKPVLDFLNLTEKFQDDNHLLGIRATPPARYLSEYPTLDNTAKQLLLVLRKSSHSHFGGGWFYFIFSYLMFLTFTDVTVVSCYSCPYFPRFLLCRFVVINQSTEISLWFDNFF